MVEVIQVLLAAGLTVALAVALAYAVLTGCSTVLGADTPPPLNEVMRRHGLVLHDLRGALLAYEVASAERRCALCASKRECRTWLASGQREGCVGFCPNSEFFWRVRAG